VRENIKDESDDYKRRLVFTRKIDLTLTKAECKNRLWGMITAPTMPTAWRIASLSQSAHPGIANPFTTSSCGGGFETYCRVENIINFLIAFTIVD